MPKLSNNLH